MTADAPSPDGPPSSDAFRPDDTPSASDSFRPFVVQKARRIIDHEDAVHRLDPDHFDVVSLRTPGRRVRVFRRGELWRCRVDRDNNQDKPCGHILAVLAYEGIVELPNTAASVWSKGQDGRDQGLEGRAWQRVQTRLPELLARLLRDGLPLLAPEAPAVPNPLGGRPRKPLFPQLYQAVVRVAFRQSLHCSIGAVNGINHRVHNPWGSVGIATLSRFLSNPENTTLLEKLLALTTWPARPYESVVHPDGTGLTEQHFSDYFDERYMKRKKGRKKEADSFVGPPHLDAKKENEPRKHHWTYATILWTYRYTMIAALHTQQGPFGEAPWFIPLMERARLMLDIREAGGDKAYDANYNFQYARSNQIDAQIKTRQIGTPSHRSPARKRHIDAAERDPAGFAAKANRRNNAETGNHAFKAILGDQVYSKNAVAQRNEILCMAVAYNLMRLVYMELDRDVKADFASGARMLVSARWVPLDELRALVPSGSKVRPEWR